MNVRCSVDPKQAGSHLASSSSERCDDAHGCIGCATNQWSAFRLSSPVKHWLNLLAFLNGLVRLDDLQYRFYIVVLCKPCLRSKFDPVFLADGIRQTNYCGQEAQQVFDAFAGSR